MFLHSAVGLVLDINERRKKKFGVNVTIKNLIPINSLVASLSCSLLCGTISYAREHAVSYHTHSVPLAEKHLIYIIPMQSAYPAGSQSLIVIGLFPFISINERLNASMHCV